MYFQLIVFDWDGTLYNSAASIVACLQQAAQEVNIAIPESSQIRNIIGLSFEEAAMQIAPNLPSEKVVALRKAFHKYLDNDQLNKPAFFSGARDTLKRLREQGYWLAVATGKSRSRLEKNLSVLQAREFFMTTRCGDEAFSKPHPQMLLEIIDEIGVSKRRVLMIGDTEYDLQLAENAGVSALAVDYGAHDRSRLLDHEILGCISDIRDLPDWLKQYAPIP